MTIPEVIPLVYTNQETEAGRQQFQVTIDSEFLKKLYQQISEESRQDASVPFDERFGSQVEQLIAASCYQVLNESAFDIIGEPAITMQHMGLATSVVFSIDVDVLPPFELPDCRTLQVLVTLSADEAKDEDVRQDLIGQAIVRLLLERVGVTLPTHLIDSELESTWQETESSKFSHLPPKIQEMSLSNWKKDTELRLQAEERIKSILVLLRLAKQEQLTVELAELQQVANQMEAPQDCLDNSLWVDAISSQILIAKALAWLQQHVQIVETVTT